MPGSCRGRGAGVVEGVVLVGEHAEEIVNQGPLAATLGMKGSPRTSRWQASQRLWPCVRQVER